MKGKLTTEEFTEKHPDKSTTRAEKTEVRIQISSKGYTDLINFAERVNEGKSNRKLSSILCPAIEAAVVKHRLLKTPVRKGSVILQSDALPHSKVLQTLHLISKDLHTQQLHSTSLTSQQVIGSVKRVLTFNDPTKTIPKYRDLVFNLLDYDPKTMSYKVKNFVQTLENIMSASSSQSKQKLWRECLGYKFQRIEPNSTSSATLKTIHFTINMTVFENFQQMVAGKHGGRFIGFQPAEIEEALADFYESMGPTTLTKKTPDISNKIRIKLNRLANKLGKDGVTEMNPKLLRQFIMENGSKTSQLKDRRSIQRLSNIISYFVREIRPGVLDLIPFIEEFRN